MCESNCPADSMVSGEGGRGGIAAGAGAQIPLQPAVQVLEDHGVAGISLQPVEHPMPEQVELPEGGCDCVGSPYV